MWVDKVPLDSRVVSIRVPWIKENILLMLMWVAVVIVKVEVGAATVWAVGIRTVAIGTATIGTVLAVLEISQKSVG